MTLVDILHACKVYVPVNASIEAAIEAHQSAMGGDLATPALQAVLLARISTREEGQRQFDYLNGLPGDSWGEFRGERDTTLAAVARSIMWLTLN